MRPATASLAALACLVALRSAAHAVRPTEGGLYSFDATDVVEYWDEPSGAVRVHYSVEGPNVTLLADVDSDGVPDFAQDVANTAAQVLSFYEGDLGLRRPLSEEDMGLAHSAAATRSMSTWSTSRARATARSASTPAMPPTTAPGSCRSKTTSTATATRHFRSPSMS